MEVKAREETRVGALRPAHARARPERARLRAPLSTIYTAVARGAPVNPVEAGGRASAPQLVRQPVGSELPPPPAP